jgi:hypothetical protein
MIGTRSLSLLFAIMALCAAVLWWRAVALYPLKQLTENIYLGQEIDVDTIAGVMTSSARQWPLAGDPAVLYYRAIVALYLAETSKGTFSEKRDLRSHALIATQKALRWHPSDPYLWSRYSFLLAQEQGRTPAVAEAWRLAVLTGPFEPKLLYWQIEVGLWLRSIMNEEELGLLERQIRLAVEWRRRRGRLWDLAVQYNAHDFIRPLLVDDEQFLSSFDHNYARLQRQKRR